MIVILKFNKKKEERYDIGVQYNTILFLSKKVIKKIANLFQNRTI